MSSNSNTGSTTNRDTIVTSLRTYLRSLSRRRSSGIVTADDARTFLTNKGLTKLTMKNRVSLVNEAFLGGEFKSVGTTPSSRPEARGRKITEWTI